MMDVRCRASTSPVMRSLLVTIAFAIEPSARPEDVAPDPKTPHIGAVTALATLGPRLLACSQAGVFEHSGAKGGTTGEREHASRLVASAGDRAIAIAAFASHDGPRLLVAGGRPGRVGTVSLFACTPHDDRDDDVSAGARPMVEREVGGDVIYALALTPDGQRAALASADGRVRLVSTRTFETLRELARHTAAARDVVIAPDGQTLASAGLDGLVILVALRDEASAPAKRLAEHTAGVEAIAFSPDSTRIASGARDGKVRLHATNGRFLRTWAPLGDEVWSLAWSPDGTTLHAGLANGDVVELSLEPDREVLRREKTPGGVRAIIAREHELIVAAHDRVLRIAAAKR